MGELIPVSRRLIFRGAIGLGAALAAPAIVRPRTLPSAMDGLASFLEQANPGRGRAMIEQAHLHGLRFEHVSAIIFGEDHDWPRVLFHDPAPGGYTWTLAPAFMWEQHGRVPTIRFA